jgi:hypothetical protein
MEGVEKDSMCVLRFHIATWNPDTLLPSLGENRINCEAIDLVIRVKVNGASADNSAAATDFDVQGIE